MSSGDDSPASRVVVLACTARSSHPSSGRRRTSACSPKEKAAMRAADELAAERRRMPMQRVEREYVFDAATGRCRCSTCSTVVRSSPSTTSCSQPGDEEGCGGCSMFVDQLTHLAHLNARRRVLRPRLARADRAAARLPRLDGVGRPLGSLAATARSTPTWACGEVSASTSSCATATTSCARTSRQRTRGRGDRQRVEHPRPHAVRAPGDLGGLAGRRPAVRPVRVVGPARPLPRLTRG